MDCSPPGFSAHGMFSLDLRCLSIISNIPFILKVILVGWQITCCCWRWWCLVTKSFSTLCNPMDCSPPSSSVHGISQAGILEWFAISFSRGLPHPGINPATLALADGVFTTEPSGKPRLLVTLLQSQTRLKRLSSSSSYPKWHSRLMYVNCFGPFKKFTHLWTSMALKAISHVLKTMALNTPIWFAPSSSSLKVLLNRQHPQKFYEDFPASPLLPHGTWATSVSCQNQLQHWWCCDMISQSCPALQPHGL